MLVTPKIKIIYKDIQKKLFYMLPEKWESIYLYASVIQHAKLETGEMFFYYIPKGVLRKNPVNVYEVPGRFNIEEEDYLRLADSLYEKIKELRREMINQGEKPWSNITISVEKINFKAEFRYDNLINSKFSSYDRHLAWKYEYLNKPLNSYNKKEREVIEALLKERDIISNEVTTYNENVYLQKEVKSIIDFGKEDYQEISETNKEIKIEPKIEIKQENRIEDSLKEVSTTKIETKRRSQILNY